MDFLKIAKIKSCQNWKLPKLKVAKVESCKNWKLLKLSSAFLAKLPNCQTRSIQAENGGLSLTKVVKLAIFPWYEF